MSTPQQMKASFLVSGIMCHGSCGTSIQNGFNECLEAAKKKGVLPDDTILIMDAEPHGFGEHRLFITIESKNPYFDQYAVAYDSLIDEFKKCVRKTPHLSVIDNQKTSPESSSSWVNWINIAVNLVSMCTMAFLSVVCPPSLLLTVGLFALSFLTTAFTARVYLIDFYHNLRRNNWANMSTTVTLGWLLSLIHTLYHSIVMPLANNFSMIFMSFIMPVLLITVINGMDEMKRLVLNKSKKMHLQGMKALFPQMAEKYNCYQPSQEEQVVWSQMMSALLNPMDKETINAKLSPLQSILNRGSWALEGKNSLKKGMVLTIPHGECFPVDCRLVQGNIVVDASLLTGEPQQSKRVLDVVPAGALNLGASVTVVAIEDAYNGTVNKLLFRSNRKKTSIDSDAMRKFSYFYMALICTGIAAAVIIPFFFNILTLSLLLQNMTGILFAVCPCTMAIAHQLPNLLSRYQRGHKGIMLRDDDLVQQTNDIHTVVFDKTGTLTTGASSVALSTGISPSLWERIYLLEKDQGASHPLAKAIIRYYETNTTYRSPIKDIQNASTDLKNRGLSAVVQGQPLDIGNAAYLRERGIIVPVIDDTKIAQGFTPVYVAEKGVYQGAIFIQHEIRKDILASLFRLKKEGKKIIMLTGDSQLSALGFNQQHGAIFDEANIHAAQTPDKKEAFLSKLMNTGDSNPKGVWFIGDGLNDAPSARIVTEKGGISCAMTSDDKAAFFTDISLNGSLDYLFEHNKLNRFFKKNIFQNQCLLTYGAMAFLAFIIVFSLAGIVVSPLIPLMIMVSTTLFVLFNSYRVQRSIDEALDKDTSWLKRLLASDVSIGLLVSASMLFNTGLLISTAVTGGLALPTLVFTAGAMLAISSVCILAASALLGIFIVLVTADLFVDYYSAGCVDVSHALVNNQAPCPSIILPKMDLRNGRALKVDLSTSRQQYTGGAVNNEHEIGVAAIKLRFPLPNGRSSESEPRPLGSGNFMVKTP